MGLTQTQAAGVQLGGAYVLGMSALLEFSSGRWGHTDNNQGLVPANASFTLT